MTDSLKLKDFDFQLPRVIDSSKTLKYPRSIKTHGY